MVMNLYNRPSLTNYLQVNSYHVGFSLLYPIENLEADVPEAVKHVIYTLIT